MVVRDKDPAHAAASQLADDRVIGVVGQLGRDGDGCRPSACGCRMTRKGRPDRRGASGDGTVHGLGLAFTPEDAVGRQSGDPALALGAAVQVPADGFSRHVIKLAQDMSLKRLVSRVDGRGVYGMISGLRSNVAVAGRGLQEKGRNNDRYAAKKAADQVEFDRLDRISLSFTGNHRRLRGHRCRFILDIDSRRQ